MYGADLDTADQKFCNVVTEKDGEDQLDRPCKKRISITQSQRGEEYPTYNKKKGRITGLVTSCVGTAVCNKLLKEK